MNEPNHAAASNPSASPDPAAPASKKELPPLPELPPVEAPSAGFIVQLFVIPAIVVLVVIVVWLLFGKLAGGERDAMEYVRLIRASASNYRAANRAAFELASLIQNDPKLAADERLVGELTDILEHDLDDVENAEMTQYVALALGRFNTLEGRSATGQKVDVLAALCRAVEAKYPDPVRIAAAASLAKHAARLDGKLDDAKAVAALAAAGKSGEPAVRQTATYALGFFGGEASTQALRAQLEDADRYVRYNAAVALTRRDDPAALGTLKEMLTTADLDRLIELPSAAEKQTQIEAIELEALNALQTVANQGKTELLKSARAEVDGLTRSGLAGVRNNAQAVLKGLPASR
ncbi:MAG: HEAT repeat domain-containing protein [Isosphaeraceae bacterium]